MTSSDIKRAINKASSSICKYKISAIAFDRSGNFLGICNNKPFLSKYGGSVHAEMQLLNRYGSNNISKIILFRTNKNGSSLLPIEPCSSCKKTLDKYGIKVFSINEVL